MLDFKKLIVTVRSDVQLYILQFKHHYHDTHTKKEIHAMNIQGDNNIGIPIPPTFLLLVNKLFQ